MATFIRVGKYIINTDHITTVERVGAGVQVCLTELSNGDYGSCARMLAFTGEEAEAVAWFLETESTDVVARMKSRRADQAEHAAMVEALAATQRRAADMADMDARR